MKILITTPYFHPQVGGLEQYAAQIALGLRERGHQVHIVTSGPADTTEQWQGLTIHRLKTVAKLSNTPWSPWWPRQLRQLIADIKPDIVNTHAPVPSMALATLKAVGATPLVTTYHAGSMKKGAWPVDLLIGAYERWLLPRLLRRSNSIICASSFVREQFLTPWKHKTTVITPGVDTHAFEPSRKHTTTNQVLFIGDFRDPRKGLDHLVDAVLRLSNVTLRIVGPGRPQRQHPRLSYAGVVRGPELAREFHASRLLVLPSTTDAESFGMVLTEAMACGLPVIGSRIGGIPNLINDGVDGLLVPPSDAQSLAAAIGLLVSDPYRAHLMGQAGRHNMQRHYQWSQRVDATHTILKQASKSTVREEARHG